MNEVIHKSLYDIQKAIQEIDLFFLEKGNDKVIYLNDILLQRAVERNFEIIGEAINRILKVDQDFPITSAYRIVGLRNQIIHGYDNLSDDLMWSVITLHLPLLKTEVEKSLGTLKN